jgi:uncharacterized protein (TIGR03435 family)
MRDRIEHRFGLSKGLLLAVSALMPVTAVQIQSGQTITRTAGTPKWEAVSIKPCRENDPGTGQRGGEPGFPFRFSAERMTLKCLTVRKLIQSAYKTYVADPRAPFSDEDGVLLGGARTTSIEGGPAWIDSEQYMIEAKAEAIANRKVMQGPMLQWILENRFQLKAHWSSRETPLYVLTVAKSGPKLKRFQEGSCSATPQPDISALSGPPPAPPQLPTGQRYCQWGGGVNGNTRATLVEITAEGGTLEQFSRSFLYGLEDKQVIDRTRLTGKFDIRLQFAIDEEFRQRYAEAQGIPLSDLPTTPSIFDALQEQLGLKLESSKGPVEVLVIDSVQKPSEN